MKYRILLLLLMTASPTFAANSFTVHSCRPINPQELNLQKVEIVGTFTDLANVAYVAKIRFLNTFSVPVQIEVPVTSEDGGLITSPMTYVGAGVNLNIEYFAAPGGDGNQHLGTIELKTEQSVKIAGQVVCRTAILR